MWYKLEYVQTPPVFHLFQLVVENQTCQQWAIRTVNEGSPIIPDLLQGINQMLLFCLFLDTQLWLLYLKLIVDILFNKEQLNALLLESFN